MFLTMRFKNVGSTQTAAGRSAAVSTGDSTNALSDESPAATQMNSSNMYDCICGLDKSGPGAENDWLGYPLKLAIRDPINESDIN
jgi:hypothetical protein